jgi:nucleoside-diphosphate-sugar epimerase
MHIATPVTMNVKDPWESHINPAVNGTISLLNSAHQHGKSIKRVVITSSIASIYDPSKEGYTFTEKDWNEWAIEVVKQNGKATPPLVSYRASKSLAEKAAWKYVQDNQPSFDISVINPSLIFGPLSQPVKVTNCCCF